MIPNTDQHIHGFMQIRRLKPFYLKNEVVLVQPKNKMEDPFRSFLFFLSLLVPKNLLVENLLRMSSILNMIYCM